MWPTCPNLKHWLHTCLLAPALTALVQALPVAASPPVPKATAQSPTATEQNARLTWKTTPTEPITARGVDFTYRERGRHHGGTPVVFLPHLAAVLDNWGPRTIDGISTVAGVAFYEMLRGFFMGQDAKQFLFFTRSLTMTSTNAGMPATRLACALVKKLAGAFIASNCPA